MNESCQTKFINQTVYSFKPAWACCAAGVWTGCVGADVGGVTGWAMFV